MNNINKEIEAKVSEIIRIMEDKKTEDVIAYSLKGKSPFFDYVVMCTANSSRNAEAVLTEIKKTFDDIKGVEGTDGKSWILIDLGDVIVNVFDKKVREFYRLDEFYKNK